jgi:CubicO group peptidase (beta-lactamase class C family)
MLFCRTRFTPLGMKDSGYDSNSAIARRAASYSPSPNGPVNVTPSIRRGDAAFARHRERGLHWSQPAGVTASVSERV